MRQSETRNLVIATPVTLNILIDDGFGAIIKPEIGHVIHAKSQTLIFVSC